MNYETPEITVLTPAISAIQGLSNLGHKNVITTSFDRPTPVGGQTFNEHVGAYADWE